MQYTQVRGCSFHPNPPIAKPGAKAAAAAAAAGGDAGGDRLMLSLASNMLEVYRVPPPAAAAATAEGKKKAPGRRRSGSTGSVGSVASEADDVAATAGPAVPTKQSLLELPGHRSDVRAVCLSADGSLAATCASDGVKVWSTKTCACLRSCGAAGYGVAVAFAPGARYVLVGTKDGHVQVHARI